MISLESFRNQLCNLFEEQFTDVEFVNAPHHTKVETFPDHMHTGDKRNISSSTQICLEDVMAYIFSGK